MVWTTASTLEGVGNAVDGTIMLVLLTKAMTLDTVRNGRAIDLGLQFQNGDS